MMRLPVQTSIVHVHDVSVLAWCSTRLDQVLPDSQCEGPHQRT